MNCVFQLALTKLLLYLSFTYMTHTLCFESCPILYSQLHFLFPRGRFRQSHLLWHIFRLLLEVSSGNLSHSFFQIFFANLWSWTTHTHSEHSIVRTLRPENTPPDWKLLKISDMESLQVKGAFSMPVRARKQKDGSPGADQGFSKASCNSHNAQSPRGHPPLSHRLSASTEPIFKMDYANW